MPIIDIILRDQQRARMVYAWDCVFPIYRNNTCKGQDVCCSFKKCKLCNFLEKVIELGTSKWAILFFTMSGHAMARTSWYCKSFIRSSTVPTSVQRKVLNMFFSFWWGPNNKVAKMGKQTNGVISYTYRTVLLRIRRYTFLSPGRGTYQRMYSEILVRIPIFYTCKDGVHRVCARCVSKLDGRW